MAVGVTSLIVIPYIREQTISVTATQKNGEGLFTLTSPRSSAPVTRSRDTGGDQARGSRRRGHKASDRVAHATHGWAFKGDVQVRACAQSCHAADVYVQEAVLKWLSMPV